MRTILLTCAFTLSGTLSSYAATLEASTRQAVYQDTSSPRLSIVSGSGKTSYVSGVIDDPTDPASTEGIWFSAPTGSTLTFTSSKTSVVKQSDITCEETEPGLFAVRIKPSGVGLTTIKVKLSGATDYTIEYAASKASSTPQQTTWLQGCSDASAMASVGNGYIYVADDENNDMHLYNASLSGMPLKTIDASSFANGSEEYDVEAATLSDDGTTIYWLTSLANSKSGKSKPYRNRAFSTKISGSGATATLTSGAYSEKFRDAMIAFGDANGWNFTASASTSSKMIPKRIDGFNVEGLTLKTNGNGAAYIGFRAPCVPEKGVTPTSSNRKYAVMATVTNFESLLSGSGKSSTAPQVDNANPILFDFGGLGIRSIERVGDYYVIVAGLFEGGGTPRAYLWDGTTNADSAPITTDGGHLSDMELTMSDLCGGDDGHPEALIARQDGNQLIISMISDDGSVDLYDNGKENKTFSADSKKAPWSKFRLDTFVYTLPEETGITPVTRLSPDFRYNISGSTLHLAGLTPGTPVTVCTPDGKTLAATIAQDTTSTLQLPHPHATYIIKVGNRSVKLAR